LQIPFTKKKKKKKKKKKLKNNKKPNWFLIPAFNCKGLLLDALAADVMAPFLAWLAKLCPKGSCMPPLVICKISQNA
jgi:hypothetical protein